MSGHRNFNELLAKMSTERRARVKTEADDLHREYVLSQIRHQVGFTQADVAERLGVSLPTYAECERGNNMRIVTLQKIVTALGGELSFHVLIADQRLDTICKKQQTAAQRMQRYSSKSISRIVPLTPDVVTGAARDRFCDIISGKGKEAW